MSDIGIAILFGFFAGYATSYLLLSRTISMYERLIDYIVPDLNDELSHSRGLTRKPRGS